MIWKGRTSPAGAVRRISVSDRGCRDSRLWHDQRGRGPRALVKSAGINNHTTAAGEVRRSPGSRLHKANKSPILKLLLSRVGSLPGVS